MKLELANQIINDPRYMQLTEALDDIEKNRIFCRHDMEHFLSVARIAVILCNERGIDADTDVIYSAALLHDIGRIAEYTDGTPHDEAGIVIAGEILANTECPEEKKAEILRLIASHRKADAQKSELETVFYLADKKSRACFCCAAREQCNWPEYKRNYEIGV